MYPTHITHHTKDCVRVSSVVLWGVDTLDQHLSLDTQVDCVRRVSLSPSLPQVTPHGSRVSYTDSRVS